MIIPASRFVAWNCVLFSLEGLPEPVRRDRISVPRFLFVFMAPTELQSAKYQKVMKIFIKFALMLAVAALTCMAGCSDDKDVPGNGGTSELPDPEGTVLVSMQYATRETGVPTGGPSTSFTYFVEYPVIIDGFTTIRLTSSGTLKGGTFRGSWFTDNRDEKTTNGTKFATIGKVNGLAAVTTIPESGWAEEVGAVPGYGYVAEYEGIYCRIYVTEYMYDNEGNRIGVILKYQAPFVPEQ